MTVIISIDCNCNDSIASSIVDIVTPYRFYQQLSFTGFPSLPLLTRLDSGSNRNDYTVNWESAKNHDTRKLDAAILSMHGRIHVACMVARWFGAFSAHTSALEPTVV